MPQEIDAGEWIADRVLAALGEDLQPSEANATLSRVSSPYSPPGLDQESSQPSPRTQALPPPLSQPLPPRPLKTEHSSPALNFTSIRGTSHIAGPSGGRRGVATPSVDHTVRGHLRSMALTERPALLGFDFNRDRPTASMNVVHGKPAMGGSRSTVPEAAPSKPRAMLPPALAKVEIGALHSRNEHWTSVGGLSRQDLEKWPCRRCHFVHKGGECETSCIGCRSSQPDRHNLACPFKNRVRQEGDSQVPVKTDSMSFKEPPPQFKTTVPQISSTMQLSLECQRRGFNPEFKYYRGRNEFDNRADLLIKDVLISGGGVSYKSQKDARDALAPKGLEIVRKMGYGPFTGGPETESTKTGPALRSVPSAGSRSLRSPLSTPRSSSRSQSYPYRQPQKREPLRDIEDPVMDLIKSAQSPHWRERPANIIVSSAPTHSKRLEPPRKVAAESSVVVELPGNIKPHAARATLERAVAANPQTNISLHFPANVSVEIAQAYGLAVGAMAAPSRRRSRSRSPVREVQRDPRDRDRERERERERQRDRDWDRERDFYRSRSSPWPSRAPADAYRPLPPMVQRYRAEDSRMRLSPPPDSPHHPPHDRRDRYSRDGFGRH